MKFLLTNDDGIDAPGLEALIKIMSGFGEVITVAPKDPQSGVGHRVTIRAPIKVNQVGENRYSVSGSPADCTRIGLKVFAPDADFVIAGINPGANLGSDIYNSGTLAAAREAAILEYPSIAISQYIARNHPVDWEITAHHARCIIEKFIHEPLPSGCYWNINLPHPHTFQTVLEHQFCHVDIHPHDFKYLQEGEEYIYEGIIHDRPRKKGRDVDVCFNGLISVSLLSLDVKDS